MSERKHTFNFSWENVIRGFWTKYPAVELSWVQWNRVISMREEGEVLKVQRLMCSRFPLGQHCFVLEDISIDRATRLLKMDSRIVKKSALVPDFSGTERIFYKAFNDATIYFKQVDAGALRGCLDKLNSSFTAGCAVVDQRTRQLLENPAVFFTR